MSKKQVNNSKSTTDKVESASYWDKFLDGKYLVEGTFYLILVIFLPTTVLFWSASYWMKVAFVLFCLLAIGMSLLTMFKFTLGYSSSLNRANSLGNLFPKVILLFIVPILFMKIVGGIMMAVMPERHTGLVCDTLNMIRQIYATIEYQNLLTLILLGTLSLVGYFSLKSVTDRR